MPSAQKVADRPAVAYAKAKKLTMAQVVAMVGVSDVTIREWIADGKFPKGHELNGPKVVRWLEPEILDWLDRKLQGPAEILAKPAGKKVANG